MTRRAGIIIASTRAASGVYPDRTGPIITEWLTGMGFDVLWVRVVPDGEPVREALAELLAEKPSVVVTSGGTGLSPDDRTPEMTEPFLDRTLPGIMEAIRRAGLEQTPTAVLSRGLAGASNSTFVINLPGSPGGVRDGLRVLETVIGHICGQLEGQREH